MKHQTRTVQRTVPHTVGGITEPIEIDEHLEVPVMPRDWDRVVLVGVSGVAVLILMAAVAWSTASIGHLLSMVVAAPVAYCAAGVFDLAWIVALAVEWLSRYNTARAKLPRGIGYGFLVVAMGAVCVNGWLAGSIAVGIIGATISGIAKLVWAVVLHHNAKPLDERTQKWVDKRLAAVGAQLALGTVQRQLAHAQGMLPASALTITTAEDNDRQTRDAILAAAATMPDASTEDLVDQLARIDFDVTAAMVDDALQRIPDAPERIRPHRDAQPDTPQVSELNKTDRILDAAAEIGPGASPRSINRILHELYGETETSAYIRTVLSRDKKRHLRAAGGGE